MIPYVNVSNIRLLIYVSLYDSAVYYDLILAIARLTVQFDWSINILMASRPNESSIRQLISDVEHLLPDSLPVIREFHNWAINVSDSAFESKSDGLSVVVPKLVRLLLERIALLQDHSEELESLNKALNSTLVKTGAREKELADLYEVAKAITSCLDLDELVTVIEEKTKSLLDADACSLLICDPILRSAGYENPRDGLCQRWA